MRQDILKYDVIIVGAGPAGCACALALAEAGLKVALLDKQTFPRDKVCGDAIPLRALKTLRKISPAFEQAFKEFPRKLETKRTSVYYKNRSASFDWVREAYVCARYDFDNFLLDLVKQHTDAEMIIPVVPVSFQLNSDSVTVKLLDRPSLEAKLIIGADGVNSTVAKQLAGKTLDRTHHAGSVRAYFSNLADLDNGMNIYFDTRYIPSYLWVFPLPGNTANVGFGMLSSEIARQKIDLKKAFYDFIDRNEELKYKFRDGIQKGGLRGAGLPLGENTNNISGPRFMLTGDAASLVDPITGEGIGNAMVSGELAAKQAITCFENNDFSAASMKAYDLSVSAAIGKELYYRYKTQGAIAKLPWLLDILFMAAKNKTAKRWIQNAL